MPAAPLGTRRWSHPSRPQTSPTQQQVYSYHGPGLGTSFYACIYPSRYVVSSIKLGRTKKDGSRLGVNVPPLQLFPISLPVFIRLLIFMEVCVGLELLLGNRRLICLVIRPVKIKAPVVLLLVAC